MIDHCRDLRPLFSGLSFAVLALPFSCVYGFCEFRRVDWEFSSFFRLIGVTLVRLVAFASASITTIAYCFMGLNFVLRNAIEGLSAFPQSGVLFVIGFLRFLVIGRPGLSTFIVGFLLFRFIVIGRPAYRMSPRRRP